MRLVVGLGAVAAIVAGCGGTDGDPLGGDGGGSDVATNNDASQGQDAQQGSDTGTNDTGSPDTGADASCPSFCGSVSTSLFCSDFDGESTPADWTSTVTTAGGTIAVEGSQDVSCPHGLSSSVPQVANSAGTAAKVVKNISSISTLTHVVLKLEVYLPSNDTQSYVAFFGVRPTAELGTGVYLTHHGDPYWFLTSAQFGNVNIGITIPPLTGAWNEMTLDVHLGQSGAVSLTYTGSDNAPHTVTGNGNTATTASGNVTVEVGMQAGTTEAAFEAYYDNVVVQVGP
jgi:hypothetical protein